MWLEATATAALWGPSCTLPDFGTRPQWNCKRTPHDWPHEAFVCAHPPPSTPSLCPEAPFSLNRLEPWCVGARVGLLLSTARGVGLGSLERLVKNQDATSCQCRLPKQPPPLLVVTLALASPGNQRASKVAACIQYQQNQVVLRVSILNLM